ncbi:RDD family protein [Glutamicibacter halophytocola]|uniref:RDD family protein n=1 Tax=Glutamicibacter halophytocola TaxID=1933880 RepID=UPI003219C41A
MSTRQPDRPPFRTRIAALLVDYALILGWMALLGGASLILARATGSFYNWLELGAIGAQLLGFAVLVLPVGIYLFSTEASQRQATVGKRLRRLKVIDAGTGGRPARGQVLVRTIIKLLPWELAHFSIWHSAALAADGAQQWPGWLLAVTVAANLLPVAYILMAGLRRHGRGPHDLAAGTRVVQVEAG